MITLKRMGTYQLVETKHNTKILHLNGESFAWVEPASIGELLVTTHRVYVTDSILSVGYFRIYSVEDEPNLSDQIHLELETGRDSWQGYLLPTGLPDDKKKRSRIIPTVERITGNPSLELSEEVRYA